MKILALIETANTVCSRYRIEAFSPMLAERGMTLEIVPLRKGLWARWEDLRRARGADVVLLQRKLLPRWQLVLLRNYARRLIFDVDDAVFQRDSNHRKGPQSWSRLRRCRATVQNADAVLVGNDYLREIIVGWTASGRVVVVPTCVDLDRYFPAVHWRKGNAARLVWIGQSSTLRVLQKAEAFFARLAETLPAVEFRQICDRTWAPPGVNVVFRPWAQATETAELAEADIGVAWMPEDCWSRGKCGLKVLQYMAAGLPVVANPAGIHREMVLHGKTGFLARTPDQWAAAIARLADDPQLRAEMGAAGRQLVRQRYHRALWGPKFAQILQRLAWGEWPLLPDHNPDSAFPSFRRKYCA